VVLEPAAIFPEGINPYIALMAIGFAIAVVGHLFRSRWAVAIGVIMIFLAVLVFPLAIQVFEEKPTPPPGPQIDP